MVILIDKDLPEDLIHFCRHTFALKSDRAVAAFGRFAGLKRIPWPVGVDPMNRSLVLVYCKLDERWVVKYSNPPN